MDLWEIIRWRALKWCYTDTFHITLSPTTCLQVNGLSTKLFFYQNLVLLSVNGCSFLVYTVVFMTVVKPPSRKQVTVGENG